MPPHAMPATTPCLLHTAGTVSCRRRCSGSSERGGRPIDFALSMGLPPRSDEPEHRRRLETVPAVCNKHGVVAGIACGGIELLARWRKAGYTMLAAPSDMVMLRRADAEFLDAARR